MKSPQQFSDDGNSFCTPNTNNHDDLKLDYDNDDNDNDDGLDNGKKQQSSSPSYQSFNSSSNNMILDGEEDRSTPPSNNNNNNDNSYNCYSPSSSYNKNTIEQQRPFLRETMRPPSTIDADMTQIHNIEGGVGAMSPLAMIGISDDQNQYLLHTPNSTKLQIPYLSRGNTNGTISSYRNNRSQPLNTAFLFIKPDANTKETVLLIRDTILDEFNPFGDGEQEGGYIVAEYTIEAETMKQDNIIDKHYNGMAQYAKGMKGIQSAKSMIQPSKFKAVFGEDLQKVLSEKRIYNAVETLSTCGCNPDLLYKLWVEAEKFEPKSMKKVEQFGNDYYCANLLINNKNVYVINGFYLKLTEPYVTTGNSIHAFVIQWDVSTLSWKDFRQKLIGSKDPAEAEDGSLRQLIFDTYEELGIKSRPDKMNNAIHASASPLEALAEQCIWLKHDVKSIDFGRLLLSRGVPESVILDWCHDLKVKVPDKENESDGSIMYKSPFQLVENTDSIECANKLIGIYDFELFGTVEPSRHCCKGGSRR